MSNQRNEFADRNLFSGCGMRKFVSHTHKHPTFATNISYANEPLELQAPGQSLVIKIGEFVSMGQHPIARLPRADMELCLGILLLQAFEPLLQPR